MWTGNTSDTTLLPVIDRLRQRFGIGRGCVVADRGMISAATIAALEERRLEYILGARERSDALVKRIVMENDDPWVPLLIERQSGETQLFAKQVMIEDQRYIVCRNETEAEKDRKDREAIVAALNAQLRKGDKALVGNWAYRHETRTSRHSRLMPAARQGGSLRWRLRVAHQRQDHAAAGGAAISQLAEGRKPVPANQGRDADAADSSDAAIRGHVFCSFLALTMQKYLEDLLCRAGVIPEWKTLLRDLDRLQHVRIRHRDNDWLVHRCLQADTRSIPPRPHRAAAAHQADGAAKT